MTASAPGHRLAGPLLRLSLAAVATALCEAAAVALTATAAWLICRASEQPPLATLSLAVVAVRALAIARGALRYTERLAGHDAALRIMDRVRGRFFDVLEPLAPAGLPAFRRGDLLTRLIADVDAVQDATVRVVLPALAALVVGGGVTAWASVQLPEAGLALGGGLFVGVLVLPFLTALALDRVRTRLVAARAELAVRGVDAIEGREDLAACGAAAAAAAERREQDAARDVARLERSAARRGATVTAAGLLTQLATTAAVAVLAARAQAEGRLGPVAAAVLTLATLTALETAVPVQAAAEKFGELGSALRRLKAVLRARPAVPEPDDPLPVPGGPVTLEFTGVTVVHPGAGRPALSDFELSLPAGHRVALVGPSGSGKSTALAVALGFVPASAGHVRLNGVPVERIPGRELRPRFISGLTQDHYVFTGTVRAHLLLGSPDADEARLWDALERAGAAAWVRALPAGLDTEVRDDAAQLAGGQRQRLALAAALLADPAVLVLDEPTESLDPAAAGAVLTDALAATADRSLLLVSHRILGLEEADEIVVLRDGRITQRGTHHELLQRPGYYREQYAAECAAAQNGPHTTDLTEASASAG
ncbi:thiol reductant ABC exporter subunit CydC [Streptomyces sp. NPDC086554]|uniref:thiol reductant ABC exporter subunit CydC n=1 Tax=Streptomyces sp. NPDC086554 TaxID=3154864 RepID=UPI003420103E